VKAHPEDEVAASEKARGLHGRERPGERRRATGLPQARADPGGLFEVVLRSPGPFSKARREELTVRSTKRSGLDERCSHTAGSTPIDHAARCRRRGARPRLGDENLARNRARTAT
jgi:hypothetical protein